jgi:hypothetical protein
MTRDDSRPFRVIDGYPMRQPSTRCDSPLGRLERRGPHMSVWCVGCRRFVYHAPRRQLDAIAVAAMIDDRGPR